MKFYFIAFLLFMQIGLFAQNTHSIYYENGGFKIPSEKTKLLTNYIKNHDVKLVSYIELNVYNDDTGNEIINTNLSHKRVNELKRILKSNQINYTVKVNYKGVVSIPNISSYSKSDLEKIRNKNRRIDVIVVLNIQTNKVTTNNSSLTSQTNKTAPSSLSEKNNKLPVFYPDKNNTTIDAATKQELLSSIKKIDVKKVKSIALNVYNDDSGNKALDDATSKKRAEELKKIIQTNLPNVTVNIDYKGNIKAPIKPGYVDKHVEFLRNKNRRIDIIANYDNLDSDINALNFDYAFSPDHKAGERVLLRNSNFADNESVLTNEMANELDKIAMQLNKYKKFYVEIQGHICCTNGGREAIDKKTGKLELSTNRAQAIYNYLVKKNVDPKRLRFKGFGNQKPLGYNEQLDKRIEFYIFRISQ
jgi:outer membrane protein OmpA-like peptidoglycan-associated protein